jgi:hypothetical protein
MKYEYSHKPAVKGTTTCGFCSTSRHDSCRGGYRNGDGSVLICGCECADSKPEFCHHCHSTNKDDLGLPWLCDDRDACEGRLRARLESSEFYKTVTTALGVERRTSRATGKCLCCGEPTRGGKFLPGHDSKYLNALVESTDGPWMAAYERIKNEASPALAEKFKKRVYG